MVGIDHQLTQHVIPRREAPIFWPLVPLVGMKIVSITYVLLNNNNNIPTLHHQNKVIEE